MSSLGSGSPPGFQASTSASLTPLIWSGEGQRTRMITIDAASEDADHSPSTLLRAGLVMARNDATGKYHPYNATANDGTQNAIGILAETIDMLASGAATDRVARMLIGGAVRQRYVPNLDVRSRDALGGSFHWDEVPFAPNDRSAASSKFKRFTGSLTLAKEDHGGTFVATGTGAVTLPAAEPGLMFRLVQTADAALSITSATPMLSKGSISANMIEFSTTGQQLGTNVMVECIIRDGGSMVWLVSNLGGTNYSTA